MVLQLGSHRLDIIQVDGMLQSAECDQQGIQQGITLAPAVGFGSSRDQRFQEQSLFLFIKTESDFPLVGHIYIANDKVYGLFPDFG